MPILVEIFEKTNKVDFSQNHQKISISVIKKVGKLISQSLCLKNLYSIEICKILTKILILLKIVKKCQKVLILVKIF